MLRSLRNRVLDGSSSNTTGENGSSASQEEGSVSKIAALSKSDDKDSDKCIHQKWNEIQKKYESVNSQSSSLSVSSGGIRTAATVLVNDSEGSSWYAEEAGTTIKNNKHHRHNNKNTRVEDDNDDEDFVVVEEQEAWQEEREDLREQIDQLQRQLASKEGALNDLMVVNQGLEEACVENEETIRVLQVESAEQQEWLRECQADLLEQLQQQHEAQEEQQKEQEQQQSSVSKEVKETENSAIAKKTADEASDENVKNQYADIIDNPLSLEKELANCRRLQELVKDQSKGVAKTTKQPPSPASLPPSLAKLRLVQSHELVDQMAALVASVQEREDQMSDIVAIFSTDKGTTRFSPARDVTTATRTRLSITKSTPMRTKSFGATQKGASIPLELYQAEMQEWRQAMAQFLQHSKELMTLYPQDSTTHNHGDGHGANASNVGEIIGQLNQLLQQAQTKMQTMQQQQQQQQTSLGQSAQPESDENNEDLARHWFAVVQQMEQDKEDELHLLDTVMEHLLKLEQQHLLSTNKS